MGRVSEVKTSSEATCPSTDERVLLFGRLLETNARLAREFGSRLESDCDMPLAWFEVLLRLRRAGGGLLKMNEVADAIVLSTGGTTRLVDRLEEAGLVRRENCPSDRRATFVAITPEGDRRLDGALAVHVEYLESTVSSRLSDDERAELSRLLEKLGQPA